MNLAGERMSHVCESGAVVRVYIPQQNSIASKLNVDAFEDKPHCLRTVAVWQYSSISKRDTDDDSMSCLNAAASSVSPMDGSACATGSMHHYAS